MIIHLPKPEQTKYQTQKGKKQTGDEASLNGLRSMKKLCESYAVAA